MTAPLKRLEATVPQPLHAAEPPTHPDMVDAQEHPVPATDERAAQYLALGTLDPRQSLATPPLQLPVHPLHAVRARLQVSVGWIDLSVGELLAAREAQVFALNCTTDDPVELMLDGQVIARGQLVALDGKFAVSLTELPQALTL